MITAPTLTMMAMGGRFSYWTPRYVGNRIRWSLYQRRNYDTPWITPEATAALTKLLLPTDLGFEWGSGQSTMWFARRLKHLTSIEHDRTWYERVKQGLDRESITNVAYQHKEIEPGRGGYDTPYVAACESLPDRALGFVLIDGKLREFCANAVLPKLAPGGVLVIDNIERFLDYPSHSPDARRGRGPRNDHWAQFQSSVATWRMIWTSSGVSDTAIWLKPP